MIPKRIVVAGGSGFIGRALAQEFARRDYEVVVLTRSPRDVAGGIREVAWDGRRPGEWIHRLDGAAAVINLTGKNINCRHTPENLRALAASRVDSVHALAAAITRVKVPPRVWLQAGAVGYYGDTSGRVSDESAPPGTSALAEICREWESAFTAAQLPITRKVTLRIGFVLGRDGGALPVLARLVKLYLGGAVGSGRQYISWIHLADLVAMFVRSVERENIDGVFNAVAPDPVMNVEFMCELRRVLHRPWSPPVPEFAVRLGSWVMGSEPSLALVSQRCVPAKFLAMKNVYQFPQLRGALENLCPAS